MNNEAEGAEKISHHILPTSATMIGVCITVIALFLAFNMGWTTIADEILGFDAFLFIAVSLFSYMSIKKIGINKLEKVADNIFFSACLLWLLWAF